MMSGDRRLRTVLVPLDMEEGTRKMLSAIEEIARVGVEEIALLHVVNVRDTAADPHIAKYDTTVLDAWKEHLLACGVQTVSTEVVDGIPWIEIVERSEGKKFSLIVLGSHGRNVISRTLLGSTTEQVLHRANTPVLILRMKILAEGGAMTCQLATDRLFRRIMYLTDFSEQATPYLPCLAWMVPARPVEVVVVHIQDTRRLSLLSLTRMKESDQNDRDRLEDLKNKLRGLGFESVTTVLKTGNAITEILDLAREREVSLIVMGGGGRQPTDSILGSVTEAVVHRSGSHVLVVR
jgi:nucleotide-binding universal stress UspA family protein